MPSIPSHHNVGDTGHAADHNAIVDTLQAHDQSIATLQGSTSGIMYVAGGNVSNITGTGTTWAKVNLPTGDRSTAADTYQVFHGVNKIFWLDGFGRPRVKTDDPTHIPCVYDTVAGQTANLGEWRVNGMTKVSFDKNGNVLAPNVTPGAWTGITLQSGITAYGSNTAPPQYRIVGDEVQLRGAVKKSSGSDFSSSPQIVGTIPAAARPAYLTYTATARTSVNGRTSARLEVNPDGTISIYFEPSDTPTWLGLDNVRYSILS